MATEQPFDPARCLTRVSGNEYLEVKWRLVWLRDRHPDASVVTDLEANGEGWAIFRATITIPGGGSATGWGSESAGDFRDFLEKAETKAIGRALAALGFGTQFCPDHEFGAGAGRVVDSPVGNRRPAPARSANAAPRRAASSESGETPAGVAAPSPDEAATQRQLRYLQAVAREAGMDGRALDERSMAEFGVMAVSLTRRDASALIDLLQVKTEPAIAP